MDVYDFQRLYKPFLFLFKKKCFTSLVTFVTVLTQAHEACGPMEIDSALTAIQTLRSELQDARAAAASEQLKPLPGESVSDVLLNSDTQEFAIKHRTDSDSVFLLSRSRLFFSVPSASAGEMCSGSGQHLQGRRFLHGSAAHVRRTGK